ncbi:MAG: PqqD family protein [Paludibacteraceae bacterium]|nr:PqqD family protein [Paludibacteraceae bacterium]
MRIIDGFCLRNVMGRPTVIGESASLIDFNKLVTLNESAAFLWRSVEGRDFTLDDLADALVARYQISESVARTDAAEILEGWIKVGFIEK